MFSRTSDESGLDGTQDGAVVLSKQYHRIQFVSTRQRIEQQRISATTANYCTDAAAPAISTTIAAVALHIAAATTSSTTTT